MSFFASDDQEFGAQSSAKLKTLDDAVARDSIKVDAYCNRGQFYELAQEDEKAMADFTKAMQLYPTNARPYFCRAQLNMDMGEWAKARADFEKSGNLNPVDKFKALAYEQAGLATTKMGKYADAVTLFTRAISLDSGNKFKSRILLSRAGAQLALKHFDAAVADVDAMGPVNLLTEGAMGVRATCYMNLGKYDKAVPDLTQAIKLCATKVTSLEGVIFQSKVSDYLKLRAACFDKLGKADLAKFDRRKADVVQEDSLKFAPFR